MAVSTEDRSAILDLLARYCWAFDEGDGDRWAALWTEDGRFTGIPDPVTGHDQLRKMPGGLYQMSKGKFRHHIGNVVVIDGDGPETLRAKAYSLLTNWSEGGALMSFAKANYTFVREDRAWKIKALHADMSA